MRCVVVAAFLLCFIGGGVSAELLSDARDYSFIFALSGTAIDRRLGELNGKVITGANGRDQIVIERMRTDAYARPGYHARVAAQLTVTTVVNHITFTTPASAVLDARMELTGIPDDVALNVVFVPETLAVSADLPFDVPAENTVWALREQLARTLSVSLPLGGVTGLIGSNATQAGYYIHPYQQGFVYVVQIYAPLVQCPPLPPHIFRTGNFFTVSISESSVEALVRTALRDNAFLRGFGENGFPVEGDSITITDVSVELFWNSMLVEFTGTDATGRPRAISWLMDFRRGRYGYDIVPILVTVDGVPQELPAVDEEYINPVSRAFFGITRPVGQNMEIIVGTLGFTSITYGQIKPGVLLMAGRQW